ncbi:hypothetical protein [Spirosoma validum]|uniref:Uncharacterized protein n=1 Tax=Spirosoma validum TaxID=2771355 RepID=A0A927GCV7_9BACT|nr:hypothetical protein [Spirosoma validum]MBD2753054.1 hypothetical protein [Spirosoma validum]
MKQPLRYLFILIIFWSGLIRTAAQPPASVSGRVLGYLSNRIGDYDGLRLRTGTGEVQLFFPPHTAAKIRGLAAVGQLLVADVKPGDGGPGHSRPGIAPPGLGQIPQETAEAEPPVIKTYRLMRLRNTSSGAAFQVSDLPPPPPQSGRLVQTEGRLVGDMHDENGQLVALLTDNYLIELKPHQAEQISSLLEGVQRLGVAGYERAMDGFVNRTGRPLLHPTALTIRGQTFAL